MHILSGLRSGATPQLRDYQLAALNDLDAVREAGIKRICAVSPTGSGKTVIAGELIRRETEQGKRVLFLAPRRELVHQASRKLADFGIDHGIILAGDPRHNLYAAVQVGSIDTLRARNHRLGMLSPDLIVVDECHLYATAIRIRLLEQWPNAVRVGLTATPCRKDGRGLALLFDEMIQVSTTAELTAQGHLVSAKYFSIAEPDLKRVGVVAGDYHLGDLSAAMSPLVADIPRTWLERAGGRRTVVFAVNVAHAVALCHAFRRHGIAAEHVEGSMPTSEREAIMARFTTGQTQVLTNCMIASIGFDLPALDCIVLARPTKSLALYLQMLGRGLRPSPGKADCLVLDHSGCVHQLGFAGDERFWSLQGHAELSQAKRTREKSQGKSITCPECSCVYVGSRTCPSCDYHIPPRGKEIRTLDGELVEVGAHLPPEKADQFAFYLELLGYAAEHHYSPGWAAHKFREKFGGDFPPRSWNSGPSAAPSSSTRNWIKARNIAWYKEKEKARELPRQTSVGAPA